MKKRVDLVRVSVKIEHGAACQGSFDSLCAQAPVVSLTRRPGLRNSCSNLDRNLDRRSQSLGMLG